MDYQRNRRNSLTEALVYYGIKDGAVITRKRGVEIAVQFTLPTAAEVTRERSAQLSNTLRMIMLQAVPERCRGRIIIECAPLSDDEMMRAQHPGQAGNDLLEFMMKDEARTFERRRVEGQLSTWRSFFTIRLDNKQLKRAMTHPFLESELTNLLRRANSVRERLLNMLNAAGFTAWPLLGQDAFELIHRWYNPGLAAARKPLFKSVVKPPKVSLLTLKRDHSHQADTMRRQVVASEVDTSRIDSLVVGDRYVQTVNLQDVGDSTWPNMSQRLLTRLAGHHVYYVVDMDHLPQLDERKRLNNAARGVATSATDASMGTPDVGNTASLDSISAVLYELTRSEEQVFRFGVSVVLIAKDKAELEHMKQVTVSEMSMMGGGKAAYGTVANIAQYIHRLAPLNAQDNDFMFRAFSQNVAHFIPVIGPWAGSTKPIAVMRSRWGSLSGLNPSDHTLNYGTLIIGSAGSGKTFFTQFWSSKLAGVGAYLTVVDMKRDYLSFMQALGGQFVPFAPGSTTDGTAHGTPVRLNAFDLPREVEGDPNGVVPEEHKLFLMAYITALLGGKELPSVEKAIVAAAIEQLYAGARNTKGGRISHDAVTLGDFVKALNNLNQVGSESLSTNQEARALTKRLAIGLQTFVGNTALGRFLDGASTVDLTNRFTYFDISAIRDNPDVARVALLLIIKSIWDRAKKLPSEVIKSIVIEEIGVLFGIPEALEFVATLYKLGRAYNLWPVGVTQEIGDFQKGKGLINNTSFFLIGKVSAEEAATVKDVLGLNEAQHELILSLGGEKGVFREYLALTVREEGIRGDVVQYFPSQLEYWMFTSHPEERARRSAVIQDKGGNTLAAIRALASA